MIKFFNICDQWTYAAMILLHVDWNK